MRVRSQIECVVVVTPPLNSVFHMGVNTVAMMLRLSGIPFQVVNNMEEVRARYPIKPCSDTLT
jgi:hypothetical protein